MTAMADANHLYQRWIIPSLSSLQGRIPAQNTTQHITGSYEIKQQPDFVFSLRLSFSVSWEACFLQTVPLLGPPCWMFTLLQKDW